MELDAERQRRLTGVQLQWYHRTEDDFWRQTGWEADRDMHNLIHTYIGQPVVFADSDGVAALVLVNLQVQWHRLAEDDSWSQQWRSPKKVFWTKQAHVRVESSKTCRTRWEWHHNITSLHLVHLPTMACVCYEHMSIGGLWKGSAWCVVHVDVHVDVHCVVLWVAAT